MLSLGADLEISAGGYDNQVVELGPGESKTMYDHKDGVLSVLLDDYQEVYNWERSWLKLKFIVNNFENFTTSLPGYLQPAQDRPLVLSRKDPKLMRSAEKEMGRNIFSTFTKRWGTLSTTVELRNPTYNKLAEDEPFVTYLDLRGKVNKGQWYDEIHPNDEGYGTVGGIFIDRINEFQAKLP